MDRASSQPVLAFALAATIVACATLAGGVALGREREVVVAVAEAGSDAGPHSALIEQILRDALWRMGYAVVEHPAPEHPHRIADGGLARAVYAADCRADLIVTFSTWYPPYYSDQRPVLRVYVEVADANGVVHRSFRKGMREQQLETVLPLLLGRVLEPRGAGLPLPRTPGRAAGVFLSALGAQAVLLLLPVALLSDGEAIGRECVSCVGGAYTAFYVLAPAVSAAAAWLVSEGDDLWRADIWAMLTAGYLGAATGWATSAAIRWRLTDEITDTLIYGVAPVVLPAVGAFVGYRLSKRPRRDQPYVGRGPGAGLAWIPPSPSSLVAADGRAVPAVSLGGLLF